MTVTDWLRPRAKTIKLVTAATLLYPLLYAAAFFSWPAIALGGGETRFIVHATRLAVYPAALLLLMVCACFRLFDTPGAEDAFAGHESARFKIDVRVLQNSVEQTLIFLPSFFALATVVDDAHARLLPMHVALFCLGRVGFWIGYRVAPPLRGFGFETTLYTTLATIGWFFALG
jgi:hypothetical protein